MSQTDTPFVDQRLAVHQSTTKGRLVSATTTIEPDTIIMVDLPYALVPAPLSHNPSFLFCNRYDCHRRLLREMQGPCNDEETQQPAPKPHGPKPTQRTNKTSQPVPCPQQCAIEVVWCSQHCRLQDTERHIPECTWLRSAGAEARAKEGNYELELLWLLAKIFIRKRFDGQAEQETGREASKTTFSSHFEHQGWASIWNLAGSADSFPAGDVTRWRELAAKYLVGRIPNVECTIDQAVGLVCRLETNSFGLYPGSTGVYPVKSHDSRGEYYGSGLYPTAAMFNHACCPNVSHRLDEHNRRIFTTNRRIMEAEECCISYFDLAEFQDAAVRRHEIKKNWTFDCDCQRCQDDANETLPDFLTGLGMDSDDED